MSDAAHRPARLIVALALFACRSAPAPKPSASPAIAIAPTLPAPTTSARAPAASAIAATPRPIVATERLAFTSSVRHEVSCSQSYESSSSSIEYVLTLTPPGVAALTAVVHESSSFGPSLGRFRAGARDFSHTGDDRAYDWTGHARWIADRLEIVLDGDAHCSRPRAPTSMCEPATLPTITCAYAEVEVLPARGAAAVADRRAEEATTVRALRCGPEPALTTVDVEPTERAGLVFHEGRGLAASVEYGALMSSAPGRLELRFLP